MNENSGIHIGGEATVNVGAMAAGPHAQAQSATYAADPHGDLQRRLDELLAELRPLTVRHADLREAAETAEAFRRELDADEPARGRIMKLLGTLSTAVEKFGAPTGDPPLRYGRRA